MGEALLRWTILAIRLSSRTSQEDTALPASRFSSPCFYF